MRTGEYFAGLAVAMVTPMDDAGEVDYAALQRLVEWHVEQGTDCLVPVGTTGEAPTLTHDEHRSVITAVIKTAGGRIKVMAGTGSNSTREALSLTKFAADAGADGALMVGPYYNKPTQDGYLNHFFTVADQVKLPIVLYNIPGRTASNMLPETIIRLADHPRIVAVKEATGSLDQASAILVGSRMTVLSGDDSLTLPLLSIGASGVVSVVGNIFPKPILQMLTFARNNDFRAAQAVHARLFALCRDMLSLATNPIPVKAAMALLGRDRGTLRSPMMALGTDQTAKLKATLDAFERAEAESR